MSSSDLKRKEGKGGKGKAAALAQAQAAAEWEADSHFWDGYGYGNGGNGDNIHIPTKKDEQPQSSLLARVGASAVGLGREVFGGGEREGARGEGLRREMVDLMRRRGDGKVSGSGSGSGSLGGSSGLRDAGVGVAGPAPRSEGMRSEGMRSMGNNDTEGNGGNEKASESQGERARHVQRSENEFSEFLDNVPSLVPADDLGFASASGSGFGIRSQSRSQVDYAASSSSGSSAGFGFGVDSLSQGNTNMFLGDVDAEGEREGKGKGMNRDMGRLNLEYGAVSKPNFDLIQETTNSDWGNVWARTTGAPASTSTEQARKSQVEIDKLQDFDMDKFLGEPGASSKINSKGENGKVSSSEYSERNGSKSLEYIPPDISEQEKRDGEEVREILSKIGGTNLDFEEEMKELLTEQKTWAENEQEMKGYEWEWKWGMSEEERERIRKITRDLLFPEPVVHGIPSGDHLLELVPGYEREREERWRGEMMSKGGIDEKEDVFAGVVFKSEMDDGKGKVMEEWKSDWEGVLRGYTDEVWGGLLPLVVEAREELGREQKEGETEKGKDSGDLKALRRLGAVLGHLRGIGREG